MTSHTPLDDCRHLREAIHVAARIPGRTWPNPPVGALVVRDDGRVVGRGAHHGPGTRHAEVVALDEAGDQARGATLYSTLEPCNHHGRTPPCAPRVAGSGIRRLVVGIRDPNPSVAGGGLGVVRDAGIDVTLGVCGNEALELVWPFVATRGFARPFVLLKTATSLDGRFAPPGAPSGTPAYLTGEDARREVHRMRRWSDLVLVGARTLRLDRPRLDARLVTDDDDCPAADPLRGYLDTDLSEEPCWTGSWLAAAGCQAASAERVGVIQQAGGTVVRCAECEGGIAPASVVERVAAMGVHAVLLEGGPSVAAAFLAAGLVDRWVGFVAPTVLGAGPTWPSPASVATAPRLFHLTRVDRSGRDVRLVHDRVSFDDTLRLLTREREA